MKIWGDGLKLNVGDEMFHCEVHEGVGKRKMYVCSTMKRKVEPVIEARRSIQ